jgi:TM2 domain-containing membrane protein YozV
MRKSIKASFLSFLFPGLGEIYLGRFWRGVMIILPVLAGIGVIAVITVARVSEDLKRIEAGGGAVDRATIDHLAGAISSGPSLYYKIIFVLVIIIWLFSIIDAYRLGRKAEPPN